MSGHVLLSLAAILATIIIGYKFKINYGIVALVMAYAIGCWVMGLTPKQVIAMWPTSLFFTLFSVMMFFGIAVANNTLVLVTERIIYPFRNRPALIPFVLYLAAAVLGFIGPGPVPLFALLTPIYMNIAYQVGLDRGLVPLMVVGASAGGWGPIAANGITTKNLIVTSGFAEDVALSYSLKGWGILAVYLTILFIIGYFVFGGHKLKNSVDLKKPEPFDREQKITLWLILIMLILVTVPAALKNFITSPILARISSAASVELLCVTFTLVAILLKLVPVKKVFAPIPLSTIIMICGVGTLVQVAIKAGAIDALGGAISENISAALIPIAFAVIAGIMSFFSSTMGVVMPTLFPLICSLSQTIPGLSAPMVIGCALCGATGTGFSPFSTQGALCMSNVDEGKPEEENKLFWTLIKLVIGGIVLSAIYAFIVSTLL